MTSEIKPLTSLRGVAAMFVLLYHVRFLNDWQLPFDLSTPLLSRGYLWVDFFFILSGFILSYVYGNRFDRHFDRTYYLDFLRRRIYRIYPLHLATLLIFIPLVLYRMSIGEAAFDGWVYVRAFAEHLFLIQSWYYHNITAYNGPSWSISSELAAYILFPLFFLAFHRWSLMLSFGLSMLGILCLYVMSTFTVNRSLDIVFGFGTLRCFAEFGLGVFLHRVYQRRGRFVAVLGSDWVLVGVTLGVLLLLCSPVHDIWLVPMFAFLTLGAATNAGHGKRVLEWRPLYALGLISYSLYMTHWFVYTVIDEARRMWFPEHPGDTTIAVFMFAAVLATVLVSTISYRQIEVRFRHGLIHAFKNKSAMAEQHS